MKNKKTVKKTEAKAMILANNHGITEFYIQEDDNPNFGGENGITTYPMRKVQAEVLYTSKHDLSVQLAIVEQALVLVHTSFGPTVAALPNGEIKIVTQTIAIGIVNFTDDGISPTLWWGHWDDDLNPQFHQEILDYWKAMPKQEQRELASRIVSKSKIYW